MKSVLISILSTLGLACIVLGFSVWLDSRPDASPALTKLPIKRPDSHFFNQRAFPKGRIDLRALRDARIQTRRMRNEQTKHQAGLDLQPFWEPFGPNNIQGRVTDIAVDPRDDNIAYVAAAEGGIFRTTDGGQNWTPLFDNMSTLSMGSVALDPSNPDVVYAGTGEVNPGGGSVAYGGTGLYRSDDQGATWALIGLEDSGSIGRIVIHPTKPDVIHVAVMGQTWSTGTDRGVYRTEDAGKTWQRTLFINDSTGCVDIVQRSDNPDVLFAAMWQRLRQPEFFDYGGTGCGVHMSSDGGLNWSLVSNGLPGVSTNRGRIGLAISASNPEVMCAIYADRTGFFDGLYRTTDGGANWNRTNDSALQNLFSSFGWWFGNVRIDPQNENVIFALGLDVYRSLNGGSSYNVVGSNMHVDQHGFAFGSGPEARIYAGNDGGVYTSDDSGSNWVKTTGELPITQAYRIAVATWNSSAVWIGAQDNGTSQDLDGDGDFQFVFGGDGFQPVPHLQLSNRLWVQFQYGNVFYSSDSGGSFTSATSGLFGRTNWNAPHAQDPSDPDTRYFGTDRVFRNSGNTGWIAISDDLTGGQHLGNNGQVDGTLTTIAVSPVDGNTIWCGSDDGVVNVTTNGGTSWTDISSGLPQRWITSIHPHPTDPSSALLTVSGFRWDEPIAHVYRTVDSGSTWVPIDGNLPDTPVNDAFIDPRNPEHYYLATDTGVFRTTQGGGIWQPFGTGLPNVVVTDFAFQSDNRKLFAGTYGRSIFGILLSDDQKCLLGDVNLDATINLLDVGPFVELIGSGTFQCEADINLDGTVNLLDVDPFIDLLAD